MEMKPLQVVESELVKRNMILESSNSGEEDPSVDELEKPKKLKDQITIDSKPFMPRVK